MKKSICHADIHTGYSLIWLKHVRIETDELDKDKYVTVKRDLHTHTQEQKDMVSYLKPGNPYNTLMFVKSRCVSFESVTPMGYHRLTNKLDFSF